MPTFTAITLDSLLEPGASKSMAAVRNVPDSKLERRNSTPYTRLDKGTNAPSKLAKGISLPNAKNERKSDSPARTINRNNHWTQISPALYTTPKSTPIPDAPSSFPPSSPYVINHKRRGPRLLKSFSEDDVATSQRALDEGKADESAKETETQVISSDDSSIRMSTVNPVKGDDFISVNHSSVRDEDDVNGNSNFIKHEHANGAIDGKTQGCEMTNGSNGLSRQNDTLKSVSINLQQLGEVDDFLDPPDSGSVKSNTESDANGGIERFVNLPAPVAEFYDAWDELSSESGLQLPVPDIEAELREIRLSLLMEIEKRKQAEEALNNAQIQWQKIRSQLSSVGLTLPADPVSVAENEQLDDPAEVLSQQVYLARFVSNSIGRGIAKAEVEMEMEAQLELKNIEIARLWDRLHYYEAVNREMSQRNQEAVDMARRLRQRRKKKQMWIWGSIAATITLGSAVLAWSYLSTGNETSSSNQSHSSEVDHASER